MSEHREVHILDLPEVKARVLLRASPGFLAFDGWFSSQDPFEDTSGIPAQWWSEVYARGVTLPPAIPGKDTQFNLSTTVPGHPTVIQIFQLNQG